MDISIIIAIGSAFAAAISGPLTAIVSNIHYRKIRKTELEAEFQKTKMELNSKIKRDLIQKNYNDKYEAFNSFINAAAKYIYQYESPEAYQALIAAYSAVILNGINNNALNGYMQYVKSPEYIDEYDENAIQQMTAFLESASMSFNKELKVVIDSCAID